eukprot:4716183-Amphidinium_carterae.1
MHVPQKTTVADSENWWHQNSKIQATQFSYRGRVCWYITSHAAFGAKSRAKGYTDARGFGKTRLGWVCVA